VLQKVSQFITVVVVRCK